MRVASLVATGILAANGLVVAPLRPAPHAARAADPTNFFDLKKMIDPENAMERGVFLDEIQGGDGSEESLAATKRRQEEAKRKQAAKDQDGGGGGLPKFEMPKLPNPFGK